MASSRKSPRVTKDVARVTEQFERALEAILARVVVSDLQIAVAYSGGLDSSVLLHLAAHYCQRQAMPLHAFHVHHGLSPFADDWLRHGEQQASALGVSFDAARITLDDATGSIEHAARSARYAALGTLCRKRGVQLVLTAHHQDDQAETVLMQLFRGAGLRGLGGISDLHGASLLMGEGVMLGRPLLACSRKDLATTAKQHRISYVDDESNADTRYRRNAIRHQIMPQIEHYYPGLSATLERSSRHWQSAQQLLDELAVIDLAASANGGALIIHQLAQLSDQRIDNLLRYWLLQQGASYAPSTAQLQQLRSQIMRARADTHPSLTLCGMQLERQAGMLVALPCTELLPPTDPLAIRWHGEPEIAVPQWRGSLLFTEAASGISPQRLEAHALTLQPRSGGERLKPDLARPSRSLKNLFQQAVLPAQQRPWLPLAYLNGQLVFAAGLGMDARHTDSPGGVVLGWRGEDGAA
ncbi:MAG: tRNA lysidine(34) synthetase TilS [Betaproteobacteria bacterium]|nr:tRNA lysidine(34) synthetase TilS [Betaproteobacteria bacterium]